MRDPGFSQCPIGSPLITKNRQHLWKHQHSIPLPKSPVLSMQSEHIPRFHLRRTKHIVPASLHGRFIGPKLDRPGLETFDPQTRPLELKLDRCAGKVIFGTFFFKQNPGNGKGVNVLQLNGYFNGVPNLRLRLAHVTGTLQAFDPDGRQGSRHKKNPPQHIHGINQQTELKDKTNQQQDESANDPLHAFKSSVRIWGTEMELRISRMMSLADRFLSRVSGFNSRRCIMMKGARYLTSSGVTKSYP